MKEYKIVPNETFGPYLSFSMAGFQDMIIVCSQQHQAVPIAILLPGQLYQAKALDLMAQHNCSELQVIPCNSNDWITVKKKEIEVLSRLPAEGANHE